MQLYNKQKVQTKKIDVHLHLQVDGQTTDILTDASTLDASTQTHWIVKDSKWLSWKFYDGLAPNGEVFGFGISFPTASDKGDYFLRTDFLPNRLFRYDGGRWVKMEDNIRHTLSQTDTRATQKGTFINNTKTRNVGGETVKERQSLSKALRPNEWN